MTKQGNEREAPTMRQVFMGLYIPADLKAKLQHRARKQERTLSALVRLVLAREVE